MSNVQLIRDVYEAMGRGDVPAMLGAMDPGIEWREAEGNPYQPSGQAWQGPDAVLQKLFMRLATATLHAPRMPSPQKLHISGISYAVRSGACTR